jgi:hypothetical protein
VKLFSCPRCSQLLFFENVSCNGCGGRLAYSSENVRFEIAEGPVRLCENASHQACNFAVSDGETLCVSCRLNEVIPDLSQPDALSAWQRLELAKRRLIYTLLQLGLPIEPKSRTPRGVAFQFKAAAPGAPVMTGHNDGVITVNLAEADDPFREKMRMQMGEAYRTLLGHMRHEIGHYYWSRLVDGTPALDGFRALFGDERGDYQAALDRHYQQGPAADWGQRFVSAYASMHPWEDWAETWAHYLHMVDTLETARSYGIAVRPQPVGGAEVVKVSTRKLHFDDLDDLMSAWLTVSMALNSLNRSMGHTDPYPFVLSSAAIDKLRFVHDLIGKAVAPDT